jgi:flagellar protein FliO/FliZ
MQTPLTFFFAFVVVLALIGLAAWLVRRFAGNRLGANANRGRMPRLAVIDAAAVDNRRRLVLVRRDNIEHLLMIGGPTDIVVEQNIVRAMPTRDQAPPRPSVDEVRRPAPALSERRSDPLAGFTPEPMSRTDIREPARAPAARSEPIIPRPSRPPVEPPKAPPVRAPERAAAPPPPPPPPSSPALSAADQNLAEMAQRLEAALRRPAGDSAEPRVGAPPVAPEPPPNRPAPRPESVAPPVTPPSPKSGFENLEDEMASLLGRPKNLS